MEIGIALALRRVVLGYRVVGAVWLVVLALVQTLAGRVPVAVAAATAAVAGAWAALTLVVARRDVVLRSWPWLGADAVVAGWTIVGPALLAGTVPNFWGGYPFSAVALAAYTRGQVGALVAAGALSAATLLRTVLASGLGLSFVVVVDQSAIYVAGALVLAWAIDVVVRSEEQRLTAQAALADERAERIRAQERAETAAHLHDSVLQTLALIQRRSGDPAEVTTLARRQERELREWLDTGLADRPAATFASAVKAAAAEVEATHRLAVEVVTVGDVTLDEDLAALAAATREALVNAAKHAGVARVEVYAEAAAGRASVFVRDRGSGFDPAGVALDRRGIRESIVGRLERHGGTGHVHSAPGEGTEVEMSMPTTAGRP